MALSRLLASCHGFCKAHELMGSGRNPSWTEDRPSRRVSRICFWRCWVIAFFCHDSMPTCCSDRGLIVATVRDIFIPIWASERGARLSCCFFGWHEGLNLAPRLFFLTSLADGSTSVERLRRSAPVQLITLRTVASHASCMHSLSSCTEVRTTRLVWDSRSRSEGNTGRPVEK